MKMENAIAYRYGPIKKLLILIAAADEKTLCISPPSDMTHVEMTAILLLLSMIYQAAIFVLASHSLFAAQGQIRPDLIAVSLYIAIMIMAVDSYCVVGSQWSLQGMQEIQRCGGLDISGGTGARIKAGVYLTFRILLSIGLSTLTGIFVSLLVFDSDIRARTEASYQLANAHLLAPAAASVDAEIRRATDEADAENRAVASLAAQVTTLRQGEIDPFSADPRVQDAQTELARLSKEKDKADDEVRAAASFASQELAGASGPGHTGIVGDGPKRRAAVEEIANAKREAQRLDASLAAARDRLDSARKQASASEDGGKAAPSDKLPAFEGALKAETEKLTAAKEHLRQLTDGREGAIRAAIERAPDHVPLNDGFLARIVALEQIAASDPKIATVIILIDLTSFGLELAAVLAKITSFHPTTYAALIARDAYLRSLHIADEISREIDISTRAFTAEADRVNPRPVSPFDNLGPRPNDADEEPESPPIPPKRPRGRPRKHPPPGDQ